MVPCFPILHLNGYKIANPTVLARISPLKSWQVCSLAMATSPTWSKVTTQKKCIS